MTDVKIIQLVATENDVTWQGRLLGLGDNGVTYVVNGRGRWEEFIPGVDYAPKPVDPQ